MLIILEIMLVVILTACSIGTRYDENCCKINDNYLEYLEPDISISKSYPMNLNMLLFPKFCNDFYIPEINISDSDHKKLGKQLNICPPFLLEDTLN